MALKMMDRMDPWSSFHYHERVDLFRSMCRYWTGVLDLLKPDLILFALPPHNASDYVLYGLAHSRGIVVVFFGYTGIPGYIYPANRIEDPPPFLSRYQSLLSSDLNAGKELPVIIEEHIRTLSGQYAEAIPPFLKDQLAQPDLKSVLRKVAKFFYIHRYPIYLWKRSPVPYKQRFRVIGESRMGPIEHRLYGYVAKLKLRRLWREYHRWAVVPDLDVPFIYVALHYQPELTTCPQGGAFADQRDVIDVLSSTIPEGWYLYVKEHPGQFSAKAIGEMGRDPRYYFDIGSYRNVRLVPVAYDPFLLIDAAKAVATVTGTVGWEAIIRGTPALVFGYAWYRYCEGAFYVPSHELCKSAIEVIRSGYRVDNDRVRLWLRAIEDSCVKAYLTPEDEQICGHSREENAENLAQSIADAYAGLHQRHA